MKATQHRIATFEELKFPSRVYKYREADNLRHLTILSERIAFFARFSSFEDKLDCKVPIRYDLLTDDEIYEYYYKSLGELNPTWDKLYLRDEAIRWSNMNLLKDQDRIANLHDEYWATFDNRYGALCLTAINDNLLMWEKYSDNFNGFCVGFNPKILFKGMGGGGPIDYVEELPIIKPYDPDEESGFKLTMTKLKKWEWEKEYRVQKFWNYNVSDEERMFKVEPKAYVELIIGYKVTAQTQKKIVEYARRIYSSIEIKIARIKDGKVITQPFV